MTLSALGIFSAAGAGGAAFSSDYELITTTTVSGTSTSSVVFDVTGLGSTYKHLQIRMTARNDRAISLDNISLRFNSDSGSNYGNHRLAGDGSSVTSGYDALTKGLAGLQTGASATSSVYSATVLDILDPFSTSKNKTTRSLTGVSVSSIRLYSNLWRSTSAITSINLFCDPGNYFAGSRFSIYGLKG
jgi:hypothetical protein